MLFYCYSEVSDATIESRLGDADYSYYFVLKAYRPLLLQLGQVEVVTDLDESFIAHCQASVDSGEACVLLAFAPPHKIPFDIPCPVIPVFAWEYSSIPNREFINDPKDSWCYALEHFGQALTHSSYARDVVKHDVGADFPIESVPAPLWDKFESFRHQATSRLAVKSASLNFHTAVIDSRDFDIQSESIVPAGKVARPLGGSNTNAFTGKLSINFGEFNPDVWLVGFYPAEGWGAWSKTSNPWIMLPVVLSGHFKLVLTINGHGNNIGRDIVMAIGDQQVSFQPAVEMQEFEFELNVEQPSNFITFSGLDISAERSIVDPRTLGIGLASLSVESLDAGDRATHEGAAESSHEVNLNGVVYTSILNPRDGRKNWEDIVTAFALAFRDSEDATLILKMTYKDMSGYLEDIFALLCQLHPFKCRIVVIHGYISQEEYSDLLAGTSYIVNASRSEGQCLPLMEYMSSGIPAIAPDNTAMADYITPDNAFIVASTPEPHYWPHDPQQIFTTLWYRPSWESLFNAYRDSYETATTDPARYAAMSTAAWKSLASFCSSETLLPRLRGLLDNIRS